jgi:hypothetical protein
MNPTRLAAFFTAFTLLIATGSARDLKTFNGEVFKNITVTKKDATGLQISHDDGVIFIDFRNLAEAEQKEFGYDPAAYAAAWKEKIEADKVRRELAAQQAAAARAKAQASAAKTPTFGDLTTHLDPPTNQTTIEFTVESPGFRYGPYDYYGRGFSNVIPPSQGGYAVPYPYNPYGAYPYYYGPTVGPTIIRRR